MRNKDYEQKKKECWLQFCREKGVDQEVNISIYEAFDFMFDRAYALGKLQASGQQVKEAITQEEIEKAAVEYSERLGKNRDVTWNDAKYGFLAGANFALGKQEKDADTVIQGWVARDEDGHLFMYCTKPERDEALQVWMGRYADFDLRNALFPDLTWESDPEEVELIIKRKKNGNIQ